MSVTVKQDFQNQATMMIIISFFQDVMKTGTSQTDTVLIRINI